VRYRLCEGAADRICRAVPMPADAMERIEARGGAS